MNWPHLHLMLNHVPVLGTLFGMLLLAYGIVRRHDTVQRAALGTFIVAALVALPVYFTGEPAEEAVEHLAGTAQQAIDSHEEAALISLILVAVLGATALVGLLLARRGRATTVVRVALAVSIVTVGLMAWTANLGGRIRHPEVRQATLPQGTERASDDEGDEGR